MAIANSRWIVTKLGTQGIAALAAIFFSCGAAQGFDSQDYWDSVMSAESDMLKLYALSVGRPVGSDRALLSYLHEFAYDFGDSSHPYLITASAFLMPDAHWDSNVNGGFIGSLIYLGGVPFVIDPSERAKRGLLLGVSGGVSASWALGDGLTVSGQASAVVDRDPKMEINSYFIQGSFCGRQSTTDWTWASLCIAKDRSYKILSESTGGFVSFSTGAVGDIGLGPEQVEVTFRHFFEPEMPHNTVSLATEVLSERGGRAGLSIGLGDSVPGQMTPSLFGSVTKSLSVLGRQGSASLNFSRSDGAKLFDVARVDKSLSLGLKFDITSKVTVTTSLGRIWSTVPAYAGDTVSVSLDLSKLFMGSQP
jgi:hypothetical protein